MNDTTENDQLILVDEQDNVIGTEEKLTVHRKGLLHRAFSIFIYRKHQGQIEFLLQQRQLNKYHSGGLWTNTCCSHPREHESLTAAAQRRLREEMGIDGITLQEIVCFQYRATLDNAYIEHEIDHVFIGQYADEAINPNPTEVMSYRWLSTQALDQELIQDPKKFTAWFAQAYQLVCEKHKF